MVSSGHSRRPGAVRLQAPRPKAPDLAGAIYEMGVNGPFLTPSIAQTRVGLGS